MRFNPTGFLQQTPNLVHCGMYLWGDRELQDYPEHGPDITLPGLDSLVLALAYGITGPGFFRSIVVPALRRLEVDEQFILPSPHRFAGILHIEIRLHATETAHRARQGRTCDFLPPGLSVYFWLVYHSLWR
jgi:hypothetical protein